jgi:hypothetical protein
MSKSANSSKWSIASTNSILCIGCENSFMSARALWGVMARDIAVGLLFSSHRGRRGHGGIPPTSLHGAAGAVQSPSGSVYTSYFSTHAACCVSTTSCFLLRQGVIA